MKVKSLIKETPWDTAAFGIPTWELTEYSDEALKQSLQEPGHYTIKVNPLADKKLLAQHEFYYCDTLIEPYVTTTRLRSFQHPEATISKAIDTQRVLEICHGAFVHGRFHRDFNLPAVAADVRYDNWLKQLLEAGQVYGLFWHDELAGFIGYSGSNLLLHALDEQQRGKGRAKYWWSYVCSELLGAGQNEIRSSISASNLSVLNLYASLGFSFSNPQDIYHHITT